MKEVDGIYVWGDPMPEAVDQMKMAMQYESCHGALMADHHIGYSVPVGGVIAYENKICVNGVGFDIACGNLAVRVDSDPDFVLKNISSIMDEIQKSISFGVGRANQEPIVHELFEDRLWKELPLLASLKDKAVQQLGTVGSGNHYVDLFIDEQNRVWIGVHFGSRGLGHSIATHFIQEGGGADGINAPPIIFAEKSDLGEQYLKCMHLAGRYAYAGREWVCQKVAKIIKGKIIESVHNHHNFAWKEKHLGKELWVVRKGATPAFPGQKGFVGGSMGDISVILEGIEHPEASKGLYSTVHGAGRVMSRNKAKGKRNRRTGKQITPGLVNLQDHLAWMKKANVELRGGDLDESPFAYKRIERVLEAHTPTIRILHTLKPIGVVMADDKIFDPYKD